MLEPGIGSTTGAARRFWCAIPVPVGIAVVRNIRLPGDDGGRVPAPRNRESASGRCCVPLQRRIADRHPVVERAAPLRPLGAAHRLEAQHHGEGHRSHRQHTHAGQNELIVTEAKGI